MSFRALLQNAPHFPIKRLAMQNTIMTVLQEHRTSAGSLTIEQSHRRIQQDFMHRAHWLYTDTLSCAYVADY